MPYSPAVVVGDLVYLSGQTPIDASGEIAHDDVRAQTRQVFENMSRTLADVGASLKDVVKVNAYLSSLADAPLYNEVYREYFSQPYPARTTVGVQLPGFALEVEATARLRS